MNSFKKALAPLCPLAAAVALSLGFFFMGVVATFAFSSTPLDNWIIAIRIKKDLQDVTSFLKGGGLRGPSYNL